MTKCNCDYCRRRLTPEQRAASNDRLLVEKEQRAVFGGCSHMWLRRRASDPAFCFPTTHYLGRSPMRWHSDLIAWSMSPHAAMKTELGHADAAN